MWTPIKTNKTTQPNNEQPQMPGSTNTTVPPVVTQPEKPKPTVVIKDGNLLWKISTFLFGFATLGLVFGYILFVPKGQSVLTWIFGTFTFLILFLVLFILIIFLGKKTHAIIEFKALMSGKPISLFFTDHKRVDWKVIEPESGIIHDERYGSFIINEKGSYIDVKTKNVLLPFNPSVATNAPIECFNLTDGLSYVFKDQKILAQIRENLAFGRSTSDGLKVMNPETGMEENIPPFDRLKESIDFSHLKSLMNSILPHNINSKIEMTIAQRMKNVQKINVGQLILIFLVIFGALAGAYLLFSIFSGDPGTNTVIKETTKVVFQNASNTING